MQKSLAMQKCHRGVLRAARIMLLLRLLKQSVPLLGDRQNQPRNHFPLRPMATGISPPIWGGLIATRGCTTMKVWMLCFAD